jgi:hypothetical protein
MYLNFFILKMYNYANLKSNNEDITFELKNLPPKSFDKFVYNYFPYLKISNNTILISLCILEKNINKLNINDNSVYLISVFLLRIADKFHEDKYFYNDHWAEYLNLELIDFNYLENKFLKLINFNVFVSLSDFKNMEKHFLSI